MKARVHAAAIILGLLLAGCAPKTPETAQLQPAAPEPEGHCEAEAVKSLVGQQRSDALGEQAKKLSGADKLRWIPPGAMVTMDYVSSRLNIELDAANKVTGVRCG